MQGNTSTENTQAYFQSMMEESARIECVETRDVSASEQLLVASSENRNTAPTVEPIDKTAPLANHSANRKRNPPLYGESERKRYAPSPNNSSNNSNSDQPRNHIRPVAMENILPPEYDSFDQPHLMPTTTEDTEESPTNVNDRHNNPTTSTTNHETSHREAISYLLRYETMVLQQEAEEMSTVQYILPLLERLKALGAGEEGQQQQQQTEEQSLSNYSNANDALQGELWRRTISYGNLKRALDVLEKSSYHPTKAESAACMAGDRQLMMILKLLTKKHAVAKVDEKDNDDESTDDEVSITYAEIIHCYRVCILGMLTLKHLPKQSSVRSRAKDRIMSQLSLFEMPAAKLLHESTGAVDNGALDMASQALHECYGVAKPSKRNFRTRRITTVSICIVALSLAVGAGMMAVESSHSRPGENNVNALVPISGNGQLQRGSSKEHYDNLETQRRGILLTVFSAAGADVTSSSLKRPTFTPVREGLAYITSPREAPVDVQKLPNSQIGLNEASLVQTTSSSKDERSSTEEEQQSVPPHNTSHIWKSIPHGHQLAATALLGASAGVFASPQIAMFARFAAQSLSLGNLGLFPASLVVVGAFAVAANIIKGLKIIFERFGRRNKRTMS